jgi:hypothetical protein
MRFGVGAVRDGWRCPWCKTKYFGQLDFHGPRDVPGIFDRQWTNELIAIFKKEPSMGPFGLYEFLDAVGSDRTPAINNDIWEKSSDWERGSVLTAIAQEVSKRTLEIAEVYIQRTRQADRGGDADAETNKVFCRGRWWDHTTD